MEPRLRPTSGTAEDIFVADTPQEALELARKAFSENSGKFLLSPTPKASSHLGFAPRWSFHVSTTHRRYPGVASRHSRWSTQHTRTRLAYGIGKAVFSADRVCPLRFLHGFHSLAIRRGMPPLIHDPLQARFSRRISFLPPALGPRTVTRLTSDRAVCWSPALRPRCGGLQ